MCLNLNAFNGESADQNADVVHRLGELAKWIIRPEVLTSAANRRMCPELAAPVIIERRHCEPGGCVVVMANARGNASILDDGYLLPLHWQKGNPHDKRLPARLLQLADKVKLQLNEPCASLHLMLPGQENQGPQEPLLADVDDSVESAFVALALALQMLEENVPPDYRSACTGKLSAEGIAKVGYVEQKTNAVYEFPRRGQDKRIHHWFVPAGNGEGVAKHWDELSKKEGGLSRKPLSLHQIRSDVDWKWALAPLLARSGVRPDPEAELPVLQSYYQWLSDTHSSLSEEYYHDTLYPQICRRVLNSNQAVLDPPPTHFVAIVSSPALIGLAHELFRFKKVLILYTVPPDTDAYSSAEHPNDYSSRALEAQGLINNVPTDCASYRASFVYNVHLTGHPLIHSPASEIAVHIDRFLADVPAGHVMWDTTSGLRLFSHVLEKRFARDGDWMLNLHHQWSAQSSQRIPCTESLVVWRHASKHKIDEFQDWTSGRVLEVLG